MISEFMLLAAISAQSAQAPLAPTQVQRPAQESPKPDAPKPEAPKTEPPKPAAPKPATPAQAAEPELSAAGAASHAPIDPPPATAGAPAAPYKPYGTHDITAVLGTRAGPDGKPQRFLVMKQVDAISADLAAHALTYPPTFQSPDERQRAEGDVQRLAGVLDSVTKRTPPQPDDAPPDLLLKLAMLWTIANNLDVSGAADQAVVTFERLLAREPEHRWANYHYGVFLAGTSALQRKAEPYLQKALKLGIDEAHYSLAMLHLSLGDTPAAVADLQAWLKLHPDDTRAKGMLEAVKAGHVERKIVGG